MNIRVICKLSLPHITSKHHAATKSLQSCLTRPHRRKPTRLPRPWDSPGKNTGVGCHFLLHSIIRFFKCSTASTHLPHLTSLTCSLCPHYLSQSHSLIQTHLINAINAYAMDNHPNFVTIPLACPTHISQYLCSSWNIFPIRHIYIALFYMPNLYPKCWGLDCSNNYHGNLLNVYLAQILSH